ncbi:MAG: hypothetical protein ACRCVL_00365 [Cetobacterium sp.]
MQPNNTLHLQSQVLKKKKKDNTAGAEEEDNKKYPKHNDAGW